MTGPVAIDAASLARAAAILHAGGIVAFPTETYYGLAVDPFNPAALERLFVVKKRPRAMPILVLVREVEQLHLLANDFPPMYDKLIRRFWPGPLTLIFPALATLPVPNAPDFERRRQILVDTIRKYRSLLAISSS